MRYLLKTDLKHGGYRYSAGTLVSGELLGEHAAAIVAAGSAEPVMDAEPVSAPVDQARERQMPRPRTMERKARGGKP